MGVLGGTTAAAGTPGANPKAGAEGRVEDDAAALCVCCLWEASLAITLLREMRGFRPVAVPVLLRLLPVDPIELTVPVPEPPPTPSSDGPSFGLGLVTSRVGKAATNGLLKILLGVGRGLLPISLVFLPSAEGVAFVIAPRRGLELSIRLGDISPSALALFILASELAVGANSLDGAPLVEGGLGATPILLAPRLAAAAVLPVAEDRVGRVADGGRAGPPAVALPEEAVAERRTVLDRVTGLSNVGRGERARADEAVAVFPLASALRLVDSGLKLVELGGRTVGWDVAVEDGGRASGTCGFFGAGPACGASAGLGGALAGVETLPRFQTLETIDLAVDINPNREGFISLVALPIGHA